MEKLIEAIKQGRILLVGECRGSRVEVIRYVDKKTGQAAGVHVNPPISWNELGLVESVMITQQVRRRRCGRVHSQSEQRRKGKKHMPSSSRAWRKVRGVLKARMPAGVRAPPVLMKERGRDARRRRAPGLNLVKEGTTPQTAPCEKAKPRV